MNYSKWIGATVRHQRCGRFKIKSLEINDAGVVLAFGNECVAPLEDCKRIRIVKRKKSQVLVDALEKYAQTHVWCLASMLVKDGKAGVDLWERLGADAKAALEKYRGKEVKK